MRPGQAQPNRLPNTPERSGAESTVGEALVLERAARARAEAADRAKSDLMALVSHELRTPMGAVIAMAELLLAGPLEDTQRRYAETLYQSARSLLGVLNEILDFSKLEAGRFELDCAPFDLHGLLHSVAETLQARARDKGIDGLIEIDPELPPQVVGDQGRLRQILMNLADNALKFTHQGSVRLSAAPALYKGVAAVKFEIADTGVGLSAADRARLFQPYVQVDPKVASEYGGTGLGLSIARHLAELMGGEIDCDSVAGEGSRFWLMLPLQAANPAAGAPQPPECETPPADGLSGRLLVVEDNGVNRMLIGAYLDEFGLQYEMASSGEEALRLLNRRTFDLVLMDIMMPALDGIETTKLIRALPGARGKLPIVALTANAMKGDRETYLNAGMDAYVSKPIRGRELYDQIAAFLRKAEATAKTR
jgi:CheY-like chemotaxis protein